MSTADTLRAEGQADVLAADVAPHRLFAAHVREAINVVGTLRPEFTADMLEDHIAEVHPDARPHSANLLPAVIGGEAAAGRIEAVGWAKSPRTSRRSGWGRVWRLTPQLPPANPLRGEVEDRGAVANTPAPRPPVSP